MINRVYFLFGERVVEKINKLYKKEREMNLILSAKPNDHIQRVKTLIIEQKKQNKKLKLVLNDLALLKVNELLSTVKENDNFIFFHYRLGSSDFLATLYKQLLKKKSKVERYLLVVGDEASKEEGMFILHCKTEDMERLKPLVLEVFNAKGGGKGVKVQGKIPKGSLTESSLKKAKELFVDL